MPTIIQTKGTGTAGVSGSTPLAFSSNCTAGNLILVKIAASGGATPAPTDTLGNTYQTIQWNSAGHQPAFFMTIAYTLSCKVSGANTVTAAPVANGGFTIEEYNAGTGLVWGLDGSFSGNGGNSNTLTASVTTTNAADLLVGVGVTGTQPTIPGSGYTSNGTIGFSGGAFFMSEYQIVSATGTYAVNATTAGGSDWSWVAQAFKAISGATPNPFPWVLIEAEGEGDPRWRR